MRIRSIKPEFWRSDDVNDMRIEDRLLFVGLWSYVDDNGVGIDRHSDICADLFAHDLSVSPHDTLMRVHDGLKRLSDMGVIVRYSVGRKNFMEITNWEKHQRINRPSPGRYPRSSDQEAEIQDPLAESSLSNHESSLPGAGEQGNRGTGEQGLNTCSPKASEHDRFEEFWNTYPRRVGKQKAKAKFTAACKRASADEVIDGAQRLAADPNLPESQFIPHPTTWLERDGWEDEPLPDRARPSERDSPRTFDQIRHDQNLDLWSRVKAEEGELPWAQNQLGA